MSSSEPHPVPFIYRLILTTVDPLFCILGTYTHLAQPADTFSGYSPHAPAPTPPTIFLLDNLSTIFIMLFVMEVGLLRFTHPRDIMAWRVVQAGGVLVDVVMTYGAVRSMMAEGRWGDMGQWRGDDWKNVVGNSVFGLVRLGCALGIGMGGAGDAKKIQ
jgi:hypothetical protein